MKTNSAIKVSFSLILSFICIVSCKEKPYLEYELESFYSKNHLNDKIILKEYSVIFDKNSGDDLVIICEEVGTLANFENQIFFLKINDRKYDLVNYTGYIHTDNNNLRFQLFFKDNIEDSLINSFFITKESERLLNKYKNLIKSTELFTIDGNKKEKIYFNSTSKFRILIKDK